MHMLDTSPLKLHQMDRLVTFYQPGHDVEPAPVKERSPAILVMTDLRHHVAVTIEPNVPIDRALERMKTVGVRLLFVVNDAKQILGLITCTDILGEKPLQIHGKLDVRYEEIMVNDIMTPRESLEVLLIDDVIKASVGDVVATLQSVGRNHALVVDSSHDSRPPAVRGIFSASQIGRQLNQTIDITGVAQSFAEVEMALNG